MGTNFDPDIYVIYETSWLRLWWAVESHGHHDAIQTFMLPWLTYMLEDERQESG